MAAFILRRIRVWGMGRHTRTALFYQNKHTVLGRLCFMHTSILRLISGTGTCHNFLSRHFSHFYRHSSHTHSLNHIVERRLGVCISDYTHHDHFGSRISPSSLFRPPLLPLSWPLTFVTLCASIFLWRNFVIIDSCYTVPPRDRLFALGTV